MKKTLILFVIAACGAAAVVSFSSCKKNNTSKTYTCTCSDGITASLTGVSEADKNAKHGQCCGSGCGSNVAKPKSTGTWSCQ